MPSPAAWLRSGFAPDREGPRLQTIEGGEFNPTQSDLARRLGKYRASVNETLRILSLNLELPEHVRTSEHCSKSVLLEIAREDVAHRQMELWRQIRVGN